MSLSYIVPSTVQTLISCHVRLLRPFALCLLAGCASVSATAGDPVQRHDLELSRAHRASGPTAYNIELAPAAGSAGAMRVRAGQAEPPTSVASRSHGTLRIVINDDDTFEYHLRINNGEGRTFVSAIVYRGAPSTVNLVATLFDRDSVSDPYIQVRGTGSISRAVDPHTLAEQFRSSPADFLFRVESRGKPNWALEGTVH